MTETEHKTRTVLANLLAAGFLFAAPAFCTDLPSGADYQVDASVLDSGGGRNLAGGDYAVKGAIGQSSLPPSLSLSGGGGYANRLGFFNPPHFTYQGGLPAVFNMPSGDVQLVLPPNTVGKEAFDITVNRDPVEQPLSVSPDKILNANNKMVHNEGAWSQAFSTNLSEIALFDEQGFYTERLANGGTMNIRYRDDNDDGILDGSEPPVRVDSLNYWGLDENLNSWAQMPGVGVDRNSKTLSVSFDKPGVYAVLGSVVQAIPSHFKAYPVPFRPNGPKAGTGPGQTGTEASGITFEGVPQTGKIEIFTVDGRLVRKLPIPDNLPFPYVVTWDVKTASGEKAVSGVYIWRVTSGTDSRTGKLMVIR
jgi:hypothetical protein